MPIFENKGVKYDVSPEYIPDFASEYPDAVTVIERPDKPYRVKASQYDIFINGLLCIFRLICPVHDRLIFIL